MSYQIKLPGDFSCPFGRWRVDKTVKSYILCGVGYHFQTGAFLRNSRVLVSIDEPLHDTFVFFRNIWVFHNLSNIYCQSVRVEFIRSHVTYVERNIQSVYNVTPDLEICSHVELKTLIYPLTFVRISQ